MAPPFAGSAGRFAILDPVLGRTCRVDVIKTETTNMCIIDHINELRAELRGCFFSKEARRQIEAELAALLTERDARVTAEAETCRGVLAHQSAPS